MDGTEARQALLRMRLVRKHFQRHLPPLRARTRRRLATIPGPARFATLKRWPHQPISRTQRFETQIPDKPPLAACKKKGRHMIDMTKKPTATMLDRAHRLGQEEASAHKKSNAYKQDPKAPWTSPFLSEAVQSWIAAKSSVLSEKSRLTAGALEREEQAKAACAQLAAPKGGFREAAPAGYLDSRRQAKRIHAVQGRAKSEANAAQAAEKSAHEELMRIDNCFRAWAQAFMEGVWSVDAALVDLVRPYEVAQEVVDKSVTALMTDSQRTQELLLATGIALSTGSESYAALPGKSPSARVDNQVTLTWKENEHV